MQIEPAALKAKRQANAAKIAELENELLAFMPVGVDPLDWLERCLTGRVAKMTEHLRQLADELSRFLLMETLLTAPRSN